jgi:20S proteasome alpha/beta subunit
MRLFQHEVSVSKLDKLLRDISSMKELIFIRRPYGSYYPIGGFDVKQDPAISTDASLTELGTTAIYLHVARFTYIILLYSYQS